MRTKAVCDIWRSRSCAEEAAQQGEGGPPHTKFCDEVGDFDVELNESKVGVIASHFDLPRAKAAWLHKVEVVKCTADGTRP